MEDIEYLTIESWETVKMRFSSAEEKACQLPARLSRIASPRQAFRTRGKKGKSHEREKSHQENRDELHLRAGRYRRNLCVAAERRFRRGGANNFTGRFDRKGDGRSCAARPETRANGAGAAAFVV